MQHEIIAFNFEIFSFICHFLSQSSWINSSYNSHSYTECQDHHHQDWSNLLTSRDHFIAVLVVAEADVDVNINLFNNASLINNINRLKSVINWYNQIFLSIINLEVAITSEIMFIHGLSTSSEYQGWKIFQFRTSNDWIRHTHFDPDIFLWCRNNSWLQEDRFLQRDPLLSD